VWHHKGEPWHFLNALIAVGKNVQRVNVLELNPLFLELGVPTFSLIDIVFGVV